MPAILDWYDQQKTILICRFEGEFDVSNYAVMEGQMPMQVREHDHRVDVVLQLAPAAQMPPLRGILQEIGIITNVMPPNFGAFWGVGNNLLLTNPLSLWIASRFIERYYGARAAKIKVASSLESAVQAIGAVQQSH